MLCGRRDLVLENVALRQQLAAMQRAQKRVSLQTRDRLFWIALAHGWRNWRTALVFVQPATVVRWHRDWLRRRWTRRSTRRPQGRPPIDPHIQTLIREMATANPLWGAPRIHGELQTLGIDVSERTFSRLLAPHTRPRSQTWQTFLTITLRQRRRSISSPCPRSLAASSSCCWSCRTAVGASRISMLRSIRRRRGPLNKSRGVSARHRAEASASRSRLHLQRELPPASGGHGYRRGHLRAGEPLAESIRGTADRLNPPRMFGSHDHPMDAVDGPPAATL
jgi:hypothetical protein